MDERAREPDRGNITSGRCYECFRPKSHCFCDLIPRIDNRTNILILQHVGERFHPFNTARIVRKALRRCHLITDHNRRMGARHLPIQPGAGLLYPCAKARSLTELPGTERPSQLVLIDGTWHQAKTIVRDVPQLRDLPCYRLAPSSPGQYRIRREPNSQSLSTLEATVAALHTLEPETIGLDQLLFAFNTMVEKQMGHPASHAAWRRKKSRRTHPCNVPLALLQDSRQLVVAYGEATPGRLGKRTVAPLPVNWVAQRLGTAERFSCCLQQQPLLASDLWKHMRLTAADIAAAVSLDEFRSRWNRFLHRNDVLIVYHQRTYQLLRHIGASQPRHLVLKSIFRNWQTSFRSPEELMALEGLTPPTAEGKSRANQRLEMAIALVEQLRSHYGGI